jgi:hypothetical protein
MGWAEKRIEEYKRGKMPTWLERRALEHANPVHLVLAIVGTGLLIYGLWMHGWVWITTGLVLNFLGHLYCWLKK